MTPVASVTSDGSRSTSRRSRGTSPSTRSSPTTCAPATPGRCGCRTSPGARALHRLGVYADFYRPLGVEHALCVALPARGATAIGIAFHRARPRLRRRRAGAARRARPALATARARRRRGRAARRADRARGGDPAQGRARRRPTARSASRCGSAGARSRSTSSTSTASSAWRAATRRSRRPAPAARARSRPAHRPARRATRRPAVERRCVLAHADRDEHLAVAAQERDGPVARVERRVRARERVRPPRPQVQRAPDEPELHGLARRRGAGLSASSASRRAAQSTGRRLSGSTSARNHRSSPP